MRKIIKVGFSLILANVVALCGLEYCDEFSKTGDNIHLIRILFCLILSLLCLLIAYNDATYYEVEENGTRISDD